MQREILLVRHGEAYNSLEPDGRREVRDPSNPPLTPLGEEQAAAAAREVALFAPDAVVVSPFLRTAQTAFAYLGPAGAVGEADPRMSEFFAFEPLAGFAGVDLADYAARFGDALRVDADLADLARFPVYPESDDELAARGAAVAADWLARDDWTRVAFFAHWATVVAVAQALDPTLSFEPGHCSLTRLVERAPGQWEAVSINQVDHLARIG
ncbi:MAG: histidine phosphatase family protein [Arachnia sp.]